MRKLVWLLASAAAVVAGCGGGGGGGASATQYLTGTVLDVGTGVAPSPVVTVTAGGSSNVTNLTSGAFAIPISTAVSSVVITQASGPSFTYTFTPVSTTTDIGTIYVGTQSVTVHGKAVTAATSAPVSGATVTLLGRTGQTAADGTVALPGVAWTPNASPAWAAHFDATGFLPVNVLLSTGSLSGSDLNLPDAHLAAAVNVSGLMVGSGTGTPVPGAVIAFWDVTGAEVGRGTTGSDGVFHARVQTTAVGSYVLSMPTGYYGVWTQAGKTYIVGDPTQCMFAIAAPVEGFYYGTMLVYPDSGTPPPVPDCGG